MRCAFALILLGALAGCGGRSLLVPPGDAKDDGATDGGGAHDRDVTDAGCGLNVDATNAGGALDGGTTDAGGALDGDTAAPNIVWRGRGCGQAPPIGTTSATCGAPRGFMQFTVMGTGANLTDTPVPVKAGPRSFWVRVPTDYDPDRPYRVVLIGSGCGAGQTTNMTALALYREPAGTQQAIYVAIDEPPDSINMGCYDNRGGLRSEEWEAFSLFLSFVDEHYCADLNKVYVVGYSTGAALGNMWACEFGGPPKPTRKFAPGYHVRAQVALWGFEPPEQPACNGPVAGFFMHGNTNVSPISDVTKALARIGRTNGCDTTIDAPGGSAPWHADTFSMGLCQKFTGCPADTPVVYCGPQIPMQVGAEPDFSIPAITKFFEELEAGR